MRCGGKVALFPSFQEPQKIMNTDLYKFYEPFLKEIKGDIQTKYDDAIESIYTECVQSYLTGQVKTKEQMFLLFKDKIKNSCTDIYAE
jgi:hypothetical protein